MIQSNRTLALDREVPQEHPHRREELFGSPFPEIPLASLLKKIPNFIRGEAARVFSNALQQIGQLVFILPESRFSDTAVLPHPAQKVCKQHRTGVVGVCDYARQNVDPPEVFGKPQSPSQNRFRPAAFRPWALAPGQMAAKTRHKLLAKVADGDSVFLGPCTQVGRPANLVPDMFSGKTDRVELLCKRVEIKCESRGVQSLAGREAFRNTDPAWFLLEAGFPTASRRSI